MKALFFETICVPFTGLAIVLWPLAVVGTVLASVLASFVLGGYASFITYQVKSLLILLLLIYCSLHIHQITRGLFCSLKPAYPFTSQVSVDASVCLG